MSGALALNLIDDVASFGLRYLPKVTGNTDELARVFGNTVNLSDEAVKYAPTNFRGSFGAGRQLARAGRLAEVDAQKAAEMFDGLKPLLRGDVVVDELPENFVQSALNRAKENSQVLRNIAQEGGYDMNALRLGEAIGNTQNAVGKVGGAFGKVVNSPAGIPLMFAPDMIYIASMMGQQPIPTGAMPMDNSQIYY